MSQNISYDSTNQGEEKVKNLNMKPTIDQKVKLHYSDQIFSSSPILSSSTHHKAIRKFYQNFDIFVHFSSGAGFSKKVFFNQSNGCEIFQKEVALVLRKHRINCSRQCLDNSMEVGFFFFFEKNKDKNYLNPLYVNPTPLTIKLNKNKKC